MRVTKQATQTNEELIEILKQVALEGKTPEQAGYNAFKAKHKK